MSSEDTHVDDSLPVEAERESPPGDTQHEEVIEAAGVETTDARYALH